MPITFAGQCYHPFSPILKKGNALQLLVIELLVKAKEGEWRKQSREEGGNSWRSMNQVRRQNENISDLSSSRELNC